MNTKMWGLILAGTVIIVLSLLILIGYSYSLLKPVSYKFSFTPSGIDYIGEFLAIIGLVLIMAGGYMISETK